MINQKQIAQSILGFSFTSSEVARQEYTVKSGFPQFKEIFGDNLVKSQAAVSNKSDFQYGRRDLNSKKYVPSQREIYHTNSTKKQHIDSQQAKKNDRRDIREDDKSRSSSKSKHKSGLMEDTIAKILGLNTGDFMQLLAFMDIKPEDVADNSMTTAIAQKIAEMMEIPQEQKQTLDAIMQMVNEKINALTAKGHTDLAKGNMEDNPSDIAVFDENISHTGNNNISSFEVINMLDLKKITEAVKYRIQQLSEKSQKNPDALENLINGSIEELTDQNKVLLDEKFSESKNYFTNIMDNDDVKEVDSSNAAETNTQGENPAGRQMMPYEKADNTIDKNEKMDFEDVKAAQYDSFSVNELKKTGSLTQVVKLHNVSETPKNEIISQVISKAKVVLSGEKSEMTMDLKPDSLGKLSLKIVTERGMVVAKFEAESQQVKHVLESNMQLLKESLEKQGLCIQGLSVSVRQDSSGGFSNNDKTEKGHRAGIGRIGSKGEKIVSLSQLEQKQQNINPYNWTESKINFTA